MAKYLVKASYNVEGVKGVVKEGGQARVDAVRTAIEGVGGTMESFYFAFGDTDAYVTADLPDNATAAALAAAVVSSGRIGRYETVTLLTAAEVDAAATKVVNYRAPGG